jgi:hypothetical protein
LARKFVSLVQTKYLQYSPKPYVLSQLGSMGSKDDLQRTFVYRFIKELTSFNLSLLCRRGLQCTESWGCVKLREETNSSRAVLFTQSPAFRALQNCRSPHLRHATSIVSLPLILRPGFLLLLLLLLSPQFVKSKPKLKPGAASRGSRQGCRAAGRLADLERSRSADLTSTCMLPLQRSPETCLVSTSRSLTNRFL